MAVVPRKRKGGKIVYAVATSWAGGQHWETVGTNKREAEALDRQRRREVEAGTFRPGQLTEAATVRSYAESWLKARTNRNAQQDGVLLRGHVLSVDWFATLPMGDVRPKHLLKLIDEMRAGKRLAEKSIALALGLVRVMFRDAVIEEVISSSPYVVPRGKLTRAGRTRSIYTPAEVVALTGPAVGDRDRIWATIAFYTGMRCGEICGLTWSDLDILPALEGQLASLLVSKQYGGAVTKTGRARIVPVHLFLHQELRAWFDRYSLHFLHQPRPEDPIVPTDGGGHMSRSRAYKGWRRACRAAGVENKSVHSTRHTFITLTLRGGAPEKVVNMITHNPKGEIIDRYNHREWGEFCRAVECLAISQPLDVGHELPSNRAPAPGLEPGGYPEKQAELENPESRRVAGELPKTRGFLGDAANLGAGQEQDSLIGQWRAGRQPNGESLVDPALTPGPSGHPPVEGSSSRGTGGGDPVQLGPVAGTSRRNEGLAPSPATGLGISRATVALFAEACALGVA